MSNHAPRGSASAFSIEARVWLLEQTLPGMLSEVLIPFTLVAALGQVTQDCGGAFAGDPGHRMPTADAWVDGDYAGEIAVTYRRHDDCMAFVVALGPDYPHAPLKYDIPMPWWAPTPQDREELGRFWAPYEHQVIRDVIVAAGFELVDWLDQRRTAM